MNNFLNAGRGLRKLFVAELGQLVVTIMYSIPVVQDIAPLFNTIFSMIFLVGLFQIGIDIPNSSGAYVMQIVFIATKTLHSDFGRSVFADILMEIGNIAFPLIIMGCIVFPITDILYQLNKKDASKKGIILWNIYLVCHVISRCVTYIKEFIALDYTPASPYMVASRVGLASSLVFSAIATVVILLFYKKSEKALDIY